MLNQIERSGGDWLRQLRQAAGKTQLFVELEAELGSGYLQRVEAGKVARPEKPTLERILNALGVSYTERRRTLELFSYTASVPLPTSSESQQAVLLCRPDLAEARFPVVLLDCAHLLLAYNRPFARLVSPVLRPGQPQDLLNTSLFRAWFAGLGPLLSEPAQAYPALVQAFHYEMQPLLGEDWAQALVAELNRSFPSFRQGWQELTARGAVVTAGRALTALRLRGEEAQTLQFRLAVEHLTSDRRFRLVYYLPADQTTLQEWGN